MHVGGGARQDALSAIKGRCWWWCGAVAQELPSRKAAGGAERSGRHAGLAEVDRRWLLSSVLSGASAAAAATFSPPQSASAADLTPYQRGFQLEYGLTQEGRIRGCPSDVNPNCVSSSSLNATFAPAWTSPMHTDPEAAAQVGCVDGCNKELDCNTKYQCSGDEMLKLLRSHAASPESYRPLLCAGFRCRTARPAPRGRGSCR